jgi:hypothetical protein
MSNSFGGNIPFEYYLRAPIISSKPGQLTTFWAVRPRREMARANPTLKGASPLSAIGFAQSNPVSDRCGRYQA